jgi:hypothetical protein
MLAARVAEALRKEPGTQVELIDGEQGELTVSLDGRTVFQKGDTLPSPNEVVTAVRQAETAAGR